MKTQVIAYSICKNEAHNFDNWAKQVEDADFVFVADTGSTDGTLEKLKAWASEDSNRRAFCRLRSSNFNFADARNRALNYVQDFVDGVHDDRASHLQGGDHYMVWVDFDETFTDGWIDTCRSMIRLSNRENPQTPLGAGYFTFDLDGVVYYQLRIHRLVSNYYWKYHAHEVLMNDSPLDVVTTFPIIVTQPVKDVRPDYTKLLEQSHAHYNDSRTAYYLAREYYYDGYFDKAEPLLQSVLFHYDGWKCEKGQAARFLAHIYQQTEKHEYVERYLHLYLHYCNLERAPYIAMQQYCKDREDWFGVIHYGNKAIELPVPEEYLIIDPKDYTHVPNDHLAEAYDRLGFEDLAAHHVMICVSHEPNNERYLSNLQYFIKLGVLKNVSGDSEADGVSLQSPDTAAEASD